MMATWDCQEARIALGVYVLGAIDPDERALVDEHLDTCEECRAELAEFMELPGLLAMVPAEEAIALAEGPLPGDAQLLPPMTFLTRPRDAVPLDVGPPAQGPPAAQGAPPGQAVTPEPLPANVVDLTAERRRRRGLASIGVVAAAAVVIGAASFGGTKLAASPAPAPVQQGLAQQDLHPAGTPSGTWQTVTGSNGQEAVTVAYQPMGWGTQLEAKVSGLPLHTPCQMWVVERDGTRQLAGSWVTDTDEGTVWYPASAGAPASDIKSFVITVQGSQPITVTTA
jgi:anti-sigma factor RsiW